MEELVWVFRSVSLPDVIDILIVAFLFYGVSFLFRGTQAVTLLRGMLLIIVGLIVVAGLLRLQALSWLLSNGLTILAIAIPVIFQPEIRRALERLGRGSQLFNHRAPEHLRVQIIEEVVKAAERLSERRHGALIVLQRNTPLAEYIRTGIPIHSDVNSELLLTIFWPKTELHDGAVIVDQYGKIASAASVLPLTASRNLPDKKMGTRHRAALGISEEGDAICVVVSEETGKIGMTNAGRIIPKLDPERLKNVLNAYYGPSPRDQQTWRQRFADWLDDFQVRWQSWREQT